MHWSYRFAYTVDRVIFVVKSILSVPLTLKIECTKYFLRQIIIKTGEIHLITQFSWSIPVLIQGSEKAFSGQEKAGVLSDVFRKSLNFSIPPLTFADLDQCKIELNSCPEDCMLNAVPIASVAMQS